MVFVEVSEVARDRVDWSKRQTIGLADSRRKLGDKESDLERHHDISSRE